MNVRAQNTVSVRLTMKKPNQVMEYPAHWKLEKLSPQLETGEELFPASPAYHLTAGNIVSKGQIVLTTAVIPINRKAVISDSN